MMNLFRYIGFRHLKHRPFRVALTTLGVAFGIALYSAIAIINDSTRLSLKENIEAVTGQSKLSVTAGPAGFDEKLLDKIEKVEGVNIAIPFLECRTFFEGARESNEGLNVLAMDFLQEGAVKTYNGSKENVIEDPLVFLNHPESIVISRKLADERKLGIGSKLNLSTADGLKTFTVRGILAASGLAKAYGGSMALMDIESARIMFGREKKTDRVDIVPKQGADVQAIQERLENLLGPTFTIQTPDAQSEQMDAMLKSYQIMLTFFSSMALLVGLFLILNSVAVSIAERKKEIGTLRALGATSNSMVILFITEAIGIGIFGSVLGCFLGRGLASVLSSQVTTAVSAQFQTRIDVAHLTFSYQQIATSFAIGVGCSFFAALWPSLRAAQIQPLEAMRERIETLSLRGRSSVIQTLSGLFLMIAVTLASVLRLQKQWYFVGVFVKVGAVLGTALLGPVIVLICLRVIKKITRRWNFTIFRLAQDNLLKNPKRTSSNVMSLLVGLFLVMLIATIRSSFHDTIRDWLDHVFGADILISSTGRLNMGDVQPMHEEIEKEILAIHGVRPIGEDRGTAVRLIKIKYKGKGMIIKSFDRYADWYAFRNVEPIPGLDRIEMARKMYESDIPTLLASETFLTKQGKNIGDSVDLPTPYGPVTFKIVGGMIDFASPQGVFYMSRNIYKKYWKDTLVTAFALSLAPGADLETVRSDIDRTIGKKHNLVVVSSAEFRNQMLNSVERSFAYTRAIELIALWVGLLGLLNTLWISVMERTREIAMLRAVGTTRSQVSRMILTEALLQGFFGSCVAVLMGMFVGFLYVTYTLNTDLGWMIYFHNDISAVLITLAAGVLVALAAGILPARRAAQMQIREGLGYE